MKKHKPTTGPHLVKIRMYTDKEKKIYDFTQLIQLVQFESPEQV